MKVDIKSPNETDIEKTSPAGTKVISHGMTFRLKNVRRKLSPIGTKVI